MDVTPQERDFGDEVARCRAACGVTQGWVAGQIGLSRAKVSEIESGGYLPRPEALDLLVRALLMDPERTSSLFRRAREGRAARRREDRPAPDPVRVAWDAVPALSEGVRSLLHTQVRAAQELPHSLPGSRRPSLATVFVRQELARGDEDAHDDPPPSAVVYDHNGVIEVIRTPAPRVTVRPPSCTVTEALDEHRNVIITGGPGQGKSTLSSRLAADLAQHWLGIGDGNPPTSEPVVPVRITAGALAAHLDQPFAEALDRGVRAEYGAMLRTAPDPSWFRDAVHGCRWMLLIDGLDEITDLAVRDRLAGVLAGQAAEPDGPYRIVLTSRPLDGHVLSTVGQRTGASRYELQPFDDDELARFATRWFEDDPDAADRFLWQIRDAHLDELVRVPLLATIAAIVFEGHGYRSLPGNRYRLYEDYLVYLRNATDRAPTPLDDCRQALLEHLGRTRLTGTTSLERAATDWLARQGGVAVPRDELFGHLCATGPLVRRGDGLQFLHHSFAEHLAATAEARNLPAWLDTGQGAAAALLHAGRERERGRHSRDVLLHHAHLKPGAADRLLTLLHDGDADDHLLAARLLAGHLPASDETISGFLDVVRGWASTTQVDTRDLLEEVGRATHHAGLLDWLAAVMRDHAVPWETAIEATIALGTRLRCDYTDEARGLLRAAVHDQGATPARRLVAAEALARAGADERDVAVRGLRSVLNDPATEPDHRAAAATVLASVDATSRPEALTVLRTMLHEGLGDIASRVQAAVALAEISVDSHAEVAEVLRAVLTDPACSYADLRETARTLVPLGPAHAEAVVARLTELCSGPLSRPIPGQGITPTLAVRLLTELGPQYRKDAGDHLARRVACAAAEPADQWQCADQLLRCGSAYSVQGVAILRSLLQDRSLRYLAAERLFDAGVDHRGEAAKVLWEECRDPWTGLPGLRALQTLARFDGPYRNEAITRLRAILADRHSDADDRLDAGNALAGLRPEFHAEIVPVLAELAGIEDPPAVRLQAARRLADLDPQRRPEIALGLADWFRRTSRVPPQQITTGPLGPLIEESPELAATLLAIAMDPECDDRRRIGAARHLFTARTCDLAPVVGELVRLMRSDPRLISDVGISLPRSRVPASERDGLVRTLRVLAGTDDVPESHILDAADLMLGFGPLDSRTVDVLRRLRDDRSAAPAERLRAAVTLTASGTDAPAAAQELVAELADASEPTWSRHFRALRDLGVDMAPPDLVRRLASPDVVGRARCTYTTAVGPAMADRAGGLVEALNADAEDPFLETDERLDALRSVRRTGCDATDRTRTLCLDVLDDESAPMGDRCHAADELCIVDDDACVRAVGILRSLAESQRLTAGERILVVSRSLRIAPHDVARASSRLARSLDHPIVSRRLASAAVPYLSGPDRRTAERTLLDDRAAPVSVRMPRADTRGFVPFAVDVEAMLRDVLTAPESGTAERLAAATGLGRLAPRLRDEAASFLEPLARSETTRVDATVALARLGRDRRHRALNEAERNVADTRQAPRDRWRHARIVVALTGRPTDPVVAFLRGCRDDGGTSERDRLAAIVALRRLDGLELARRIRDDDRGPAAVRWRAVLVLSGSPHDRAAGARLLELIARDRAQPPALRQRAAGDLTGLGVSGRALGACALGELVDDDRLPVLTRTAAARDLGRAQPDDRDRVLRVLRSLLTDAPPLVQVRVLRAIGNFDPADGVNRLRAMLDTAEPGPVARVRAAEALAGMHRGYRDEAAAAVREIAIGEAVAGHVRVHAARDLARWSLPCRDEARRLILGLRTAAR